MTVALSASNLTAGYGPADIIQGVSVEGLAGAVLTIIGPNGSGKSTLLKVLAGLVRPRTGAILVKGRDVTETSASVRVAAGLGYVPQERNVFPNLSVAENISLAVECLPPGRMEAARQSASQMFEMFPVLAERMAETAGHLSGGERQMLAFGCALVSEPAVLLLDEPSAGLSPKYAEGIFALVRRIADRGTAIILVEQNVVPALRVSDTCLVMANGRERLRAPAAAILTHPDIHTLYLGEQASQEPIQAAVAR